MSETINEIRQPDRLYTVIALDGDSDWVVSGIAVMSDLKREFPNMVSITGDPNGVLYLDYDVMAVPHHGPLFKFSEDEMD